MTFFGLLLIVALQPPAGESNPTRDNTVPTTQKPEKPGRKRWEMKPVRVRGTTPRPGVVFVEADREHVRAVLQAMMAETRSGAFTASDVSRPIELPSRAARVRNIEVRGPVREGLVLRALKPELGALAECRRAEKRPPVVEINLKLKLKLDENGTVTTGQIVLVQPQAPRASTCVLARLKRISFPASPAGSVTVKLTLVLPPPLNHEPAIKPSVRNRKAKTAP